jgi:hypothetical protein
MMNKTISIPCFQCAIYTAYTNQKNEPTTIRTNTVKQEKTRDPEPLEDLMDFISENPCALLFCGIFIK